MIKAGNEEYFINMVHNKDTNEDENTFMKVLMIKELWKQDGFDEIKTFIKRYLKVLVISCERVIYFQSL